MTANRGGDCERFLRYGTAFFPVDVDGVGEQLQVLFTDGACEVWPTQVRGFLKRLFRFLGNDLRALRIQYGGVLGKKQLVPLPLSARQVLIPMRTRIPLGEESAYGWISSTAVEGVEPVAPRQTEIRLRGGHRLTVFHSLSFCRDQLRNAQLVQYRYWQLHLSESPFSPHVEQEDEKPQVNPSD